MEHINLHRSPRLKKPVMLAAWPGVSDVALEVAAYLLDKLDAKMTSAFYGVLEMAEKEKVYMRDAAYMVAIDRVVKAMQLRGWA